MKELRSNVSFTQLRFYCSKQQGRTFHVTTAANSIGEAVVQYFSGQTDARSDACGSFVRMEDDNSAMAKVCKKWGGTKSLDQFTNKWSLDDQNYEKRLYDHVVLVWYKQHWLLSPESKRFECDDFKGSVSTGDFWKMYVCWGLNNNLHKILFAIIVVQTALSNSFFHCCIRFNEIVTGYTLIIALLFFVKGKPCPIIFSCLYLISVLAPYQIGNLNGTEWSLIRSGIIRVITISYSLRTIVRF